jgi:putative sterol carrier protein
LTADDLTRWRDGLKLSPAGANRVATILRAALNQRAKGDRSITNRDAWKDGLSSIANADQPRNVILADTDVRRLVEEAYAISAEFGRLVELAAIIGARYDQLARIEVKDLQAATVMVPRSHKGKGEKRITHYSAPIPAALADALRVAAVGRKPTDRLLLKPNGEPWAKSDHGRLFTRATIRAGINPELPKVKSGSNPAKPENWVTIYALRHSSIVRQLLAGIPIRIVAVKHDTSVAMIERTYSAHIGDHADDMVRAVMLDTSRTPADVVRLRG